MGYVDFQSAMLGSAFVLTDSGGIQEETTALGIGCITMRTTTERPITIDIGTNVLVPPNRENLYKTIYQYLNLGVEDFQVPDKWDGKAAYRIAQEIDKILNGK
jgi:UDP-N-acetylglucosamine 2-epimerase (non-hydrolysing)